jgi:hypothetical protein
VVSLAALGLFFGSNLVLGLAGWEKSSAGRRLIALGIEVFVLPGFGVVLSDFAIGTAIVLAMLGGPHPGRRHRRPFSSSAQVSP